MRNVPSFVADAEKVTAFFICQTCWDEYAVTVPRADFFSWALQGTHVQDAFPYLDPATRELFVSSTCNSCFELMFAPEET